jgi:hypothetical protein
MPAHSRSKNGVASLAYVAGIHVFLAARKQDVDGRDKPNQVTGNQTTGNFTGSVGLQ